MNIKEFSKILANHIEVTPPQANWIINTVFGLIGNILQNGGNVNILRFGRFSTRIRKSRKGVDPRTLNPIDIPDVRVVKFLASKSLKKLLK